MYVYNIYIYVYTHVYAIMHIYIHTLCLHFIVGFSNWNRVFDLCCHHVFTLVHDTPALDSRHSRAFTRHRHPSRKRTDGSAPPPVTKLTLCLGQRCVDKMRNTEKPLRLIGSRSFGEYGEADVAYDQIAKLWIKM